MAQNRVIFYDWACDQGFVIPWIMGCFLEWIKNKKAKEPRSILYPSLNVDSIVVFFDGVDQAGLCGAGMVLKINPFLVVKSWMRDERGANACA